MYHVRLALWKSVIPRPASSEHGLLPSEHFQPRRYMDPRSILASRLPMASLLNSIIRVESMTAHCKCRKINIAPELTYFRQ